MSENTQIAGDDDRLLEELVARDHRRIRDLIVESSRRTSTPGVHRELGEHLRTRLGGQLMTEAQLLEPAVADVVGSDAAGHLERQRADLHRQLDVEADSPSSPVGAGLAASFDAHTEHLGRVLAQFRQASSARARALAFAYADRADATSEP